jgi:hypothetical protein
MATRIKHKRSAVAGKKPIVSQLESGELAINTADGKVFLLRDDNTVQDITKRVFENDTQVLVSDAGDSSQAQVSIDVNGVEQLTVTEAGGFNFKNNVDIEDAGTLTFRELTASGEDGVTLKAPNTLDSGYQMTLPSRIGTNGQVLAINANGQLFFNDPDIFGGNVVYVSQEQGDDANDGQSAPVKTIKRACQIASGLVYNADTTINFKRINIKVAVGDYTEDNPVIVPDNVVIKGDGLRGCIIRPANANLDMLRVRNACYFGEFTFRDGVDANFVPLVQADYAVAFDDPFDPACDRTGYTNLPNTRPTITTSPYVQNTSIISFLGMNGAKIDGTKVQSPNVPINAIEAENPTIGGVPEQGKSMVANAFTHISFGGTGWRLTNDAYAQIVSCFQIFLLNGVYCQSGGYCSITNSATNFGLYALRSSGYSPKAFDFDRAFVTSTGSSEGKQTITIVGINRDTPVEEYVLRFRDPAYKRAYTQLLLAKDLIATATVNYINSQVSAATPSIWAGFTYNEAKCARDVQLIIDAIKWDIMFNANYRTVNAGLAYWRANANNVITLQKDQTLAAYTQAKTFTVNALSDSTMKTRAGLLWDEIIDIIENGSSTVAPGSVADAYVFPDPTDYNTSYLVGYGDARAQIIANKTFMQDEIDAWIAFQVANNIDPYTAGFSYDAAKCRRDTGLVIDALIYDLTYGGNLETFNAAVAYFVGAIAQYGSGKKEETLASYVRLKEVIQQVIAETLVTKTAGNTSTQDTSGTPGSAESITFAGARIQEIIDFITADGTGLTKIEPGTSWVNPTFVTDATVNLSTTGQINISQRVTQYINEQIQANIWYGFIYDQAKCNRDTQLIVEAVAKDTWDTGNRYSRSAGLSYYTRNLQDSSRISISGQELQTIAAINFAKTEAITYITNLSAGVQNFVGGKFDVVTTIINDPTDLPDPTEVSSEGDITNSFKSAPVETTFDAATDVNVATNIFTIVGHGFNNGQRVIYDNDGGTIVSGLDPEQTYYIKIVNEDEFSLTFDESLLFNVNVLAVGVGTQKFLSGVIEFFVEEILSSHQTYQTLILESGAESYEFVPGRAITGTTGGNNNSAIVQDWEPRERRLTVSIEQVAVGSSLLRIQFNETSTITSDHAGSPNTSIGVNEAASRQGLGTASFSITATDGSSSLTNLINLLEKQCWFHRPSIVNSSSHTWEYAGSGTDYNALPQNGGNTRAQFEQFEELPGRVYSSGTNELGDFKVGDFITAFNRTGNITFRNRVQVDELDALRLSLSDVAIEEISANVNLGDDEIGGPSDARLSTQLAVRSFISNRLGGFVDKSVSTAAVPGAIVQLNTNGQLNPDLIPATRQFTNTNTPGYLSRLEQVDEIPAVDLKAGDIGTENYEQVELTLSGNITATDGALITQPGITGATGYAKGSYSSSGNILVASLTGGWDDNEDSTGDPWETGVSAPNLFVNGVDSGVRPDSKGSSSAITDNFFLRSSNTSQYLILDTSGTYTFTSATVTNVARSSNIATITTSGAHNFNVGNNVQIIVGSDTTYTRNGLVLSTPTGVTFTIANNGDNESTKAVTGATARTIVSSADGNAQGAVTETRYGVLTNVDNANISSGSLYTPVTGSKTYSNVSLTSTTGVGTGAKADITVTAGQVTDVDLRRGGTGYAVGDLLSASAANIGGTGSGFEVEVTAIEKRAYVDILGGELFIASASSVDFVEDNLAITTSKTVNLDDVISHNFLAGDVGAGGAVNYTTYRITIPGHGLGNGNPVTYTTLGNVPIGGLLNNSIYYAKPIDGNTIELYEDFSLLNIVEFTSTPANNNHNITRFTVNLTNNSIIVANHGYTTGDAVRILSLDDGSSVNALPSVGGTAIPSGSRFFVGSVTTSSFTLHELRSDALSSVNGLVTNAQNIDGTGVGSAEFIRNNVQINAVVNTSSRIKVNWNSLAVTNIDASNIISGTVSPSRLGATGIPNSDTALFGDSSYKNVVQTLKKANTVDNPITLTGSSVGGEFYGDPVNIGIANTDFDPLGTFSTLGTSRFLQTQFNVNTDGSGEVFIKDGVVDAGTLDGLDSAFFLNPSNLTSPVPVTRGGTNITTYAVGDLIYAQSTGSLNTLNIGRNNAFLKSNGTVPEWGTALDLSEGLDVGSAKLTSRSTGSGSLYNENVTSLEIGGAATNIKIGSSTATRSLLTFARSYEATASQDVVVNLANVVVNTNALTANGDTEVPMSSTANILAGMVVTGSGSIPSNTTVSGVTDDFIYLSNPTTGTILNSTSLTFTYTPFTIGVKVGDTINIASSAITNLNGSWPVVGATFNATSFTIRTDANVTANPLNVIAGTLSIDNNMVIRNTKVVFGTAETSATPTNAIIKGGDGVGTDIAGGALTIEGGIGTGNATGGDVVIKTGAVSTTSDIQHTSTERVRIDTSGKATFTGEIAANGGTISTNQTTANLLDTTATTINMGGAATTVEIGAATGTTTIHNNVDIDLDLNVDGGDITTNATTFNLINTNATTLNIGGAATTVNIGTGGDGGGTTTIGHDLVVTGDLTVNGSTTVINSTTLTVDDLNIVLASGAANATAANGAGITIDGANATLTYDSVNTAFDSSEDFNLASSKAYFINDASVLSSTTLGTNVVNSSLQSVGTIGTGTWQGTVISPTYGGTGVNNGTKTITLGGNFTHTGAHSLGLTTTGNTSITLPTSGTLAITGNPLSQFAATTSAQLAEVISDETGSGALVFQNNPTFTSGVSTSSTTFNVFNTNATTVNAFGAGTTIGIGAASGTTTINNDLAVTGNLQIGGLSDLSVSGGTFTLANTGATTVNAFGAATTINMGAATGNFNIANANVNLAGNLFVNGNTLDTDETGTFNLLKDNATNIAFGQAARQMTIGETKAAAVLAGQVNPEVIVRLDLRTNADMYIDGQLFVSSINNTPIGNTTPSSGAFTTLASNNLVTFTDATNATGSTFAGGSAAVKISGGLYVNKDIRADNFIGDMDAGNLTSGTIPDARIQATGVTQHQLSITGTGILNAGSINTGFGNINIGTSIFSGDGSGITTLNASNLSSGTIPDARIQATGVTQHQLSITGTGALNAGSITSGFGNIDIGTDTFTGNGSGLTTLNASNLSSGTVAGARLGGNQTMEGIKTFSDTSAATTTATGAVRVGGGMGVVGDLYAGSLNTANGAGIQALNATNLGSGTVPNGRISGIYSNLTGTGALNQGEITSGFGNINIGTDTFTGNGSGLTNVNADTLDSLDSGSFVRSDAADTVTGLITTSLSGEQMQFSDTSATGSPFIGFYQGATRRGYIQYVNGGTMRIASDATSERLDIGSGLTGLTFYENVTNASHTVWHAGNDGTGSGLDADTVDGLDSGSFIRSDANDTFSGTLSGSGSINITGNIAATNFTGNGSGLTGITADNANTLDSIDSTSFLRSDVADIVGGTLTFSDNIELRLGTGSDTRFYHNGTNTFIDHYTGDLFIRDNTTTRFTFARTTGNLTATGEITAFSDCNLKDNIEIIADPLSKILSIRGVTFTRKDLEDKETRHMGVIAQEIEQYFPEVVHTTEDGIKTVNYGAMAGAFIEAFKAQQNQIDELRSMVEKLLDK